jgi:hypothetical protein
MPVAASLALLAACQAVPDLSAPSGQSLKIAVGAGGGPPAGPPSAKTPPKAAQSPTAPCEKDFWGNCAQATAAVLPPAITPSPPATQPRAKGPKTPAAPCEKDFWGNCTQPKLALLPPSILAPSPPAGPPAKAREGPSPPCEKDFWGNCTQAIPSLFATPAAPPKADSSPKATCVRDFWGNCTPVASNRHAYRWRYVRPGRRRPEASGGGGGGGGRVEHAGPSVVCHPRRRVIGEEQPSTEQAQQAAEQAWMGSVRYDYGERYQNLSMAREVRYTCAPSSPSGTLKRGMFRCAAEAIPCRGAGN